MQCTFELRGLEVGGGSWQKEIGSIAAGVLWPVIAKSAGASETLTYGQLAPLIGTNPLSVGYALGPIQDFCLEMRLPPLTAIVIGKNSNVPGSGFIAWDVDDLPTAQALVFDEDWRKVPNPYGAFGSTDTETSFADQILKNPEVAADIYARVKVRGIAQRIFRVALLKAYGHRCAFCGIIPTALNLDLRPISCSN